MVDYTIICRCRILQMLKDGSSGKSPKCNVLTRQWLSSVSAVNNDQADESDAITWILPVDDVGFI